jgi:hypothetical protein
VNRLSRSNEIVDAAGLFLFMKRKRDGRLAIGFNPGSPETIGNVNVRERNRLNRIVASRLRRRTCQDDEESPPT